MPSGYWLEHPYRCRFRASSTDCHEQPVQLRDDQGSPRAGSRADNSYPLIAPLVLLEHIDLTGPATHIAAMTLRIDKHVVRIAAGIQVGNDGVIGRGQHQQSGWAAKDDQN